MNKLLLHDFLEEKYLQYNNQDFITADPIQIPHLFSEPPDIEISGFFAATFAWGQRPVIIRKSRVLMEMMDFAPHDFIVNHTKNDLQKLRDFKYRTFNFTDLTFFLNSLQHIYRHHKSLEELFMPLPGEENMRWAISRFRGKFLAVPHEKRSEKHISNPENSACKRINMFLRWMVRSDNTGVDFGIWRNISPALLSCPLDVHSARVARKLGLLSHKQNNWKAVEELDTSLRKLDPEDPVKYDFALFGLGISEKF